VLVAEVTCAVLIMRLVSSFLSILNPISQSSSSEKLFLSNISGRKSRSPIPALLTQPYPGSRHLFPPSSSHDPNCCMQFCLLLRLIGQVKLLTRPAGQACWGLMPSGLLSCTPGITRNQFLNPQKFSCFWECDRH
jgi:hypothetical protein